MSMMVACGVEGENEVYCGDGTVQAGDTCVVAETENVNSETEEQDSDTPAVKCGEGTIFDQKNSECVVEDREEREEYLLSLGSVCEMDSQCKSLRCDFIQTWGIIEKKVCTMHCMYAPASGCPEDFRCAPQNPTTWEPVCVKIEHCSGKDENHNGSVDSYCKCDNDADCKKGSICVYTSDGYKQCKSTNPEHFENIYNYSCEYSYHQGEESCNGRDDDCDGTIDEGCQRQWSQK